MKSTQEKLPLSTLVERSEQGPYCVEAIGRVRDLNDDRTHAGDLGRLAIATDPDNRALGKIVCILPGATGQDLAHAELIAHSLVHLPKLVGAVRAFLAGDRWAQHRLKDALVEAENVTCYP